MTGATDDGQEEGTQGREDSDTTGMLAQQTLHDLNHPVHTAGCLQDTSARHGCHNDIDHISRRGAGFQSMVENENGQS